MNKQNLENRVKEYITIQHEGETWDFKRQWYDKEKGKADLLHDIICMANTIEDEDGLILIGVDEEDEYAIRDVTSDKNRKDTNELVKFLRDKPFAGGVRPKIEVENLSVEGKTIDVIVVKNSTKVPFYLRERFLSVEPFHIYTRVGDTNTPVDKSADVDKTEELWKKRFGIGENTLQRIQRYLKDAGGWGSVDGQQTFFYKLFPEFRIKIESDESQRNYEYYCFSQLGLAVGWYHIRLLCHDTVIDETSGISLNGGRFFTAVPEELFTTGADAFYCYVSGSLRYDLRNLLLSKMTDTDYDSISRWNECIPIFASRDEKEAFLKYLDMVDIKPMKEYGDWIPDVLPNGEDGKRYRRQYSMAITITELLNSYRRTEENERLRMIKDGKDMV